MSLLLLTVTLRGVFNKHCLLPLFSSILQIAFLEVDRYLEFHTQFGRYYRTRIPKYGRDMAYHTANCDLYVVGVR